jgi:hypothetical protein
MKLQTVPTAGVADPSDFISKPIFDEIGREFQTVLAIY